MEINKIRERNQELDIRIDFRGSNNRIIPKRIRVSQLPIPKRKYPIKLKSTFYKAWPHNPEFASTREDTEHPLGREMVKIYFIEIAAFVNTQLVPKY